MQCGSWVLKGITLLHKHRACILSALHDICSSLILAMHTQEFHSDTSVHWPCFCTPCILPDLQLAYWVTPKVRAYLLAAPHAYYLVTGYSILVSCFTPPYHLSRSIILSLRATTNAFSNSDFSRKSNRPVFIHYLTATHNENTSRLYVPRAIRLKCSATSVATYTFGRSSKVHSK